ncbi:MAG: hypothetical protein QXP53_02315 [Candidatus Pacearchaeota archaeon]
MNYYYFAGRMYKKNNFDSNFKNFVRVREEEKIIKSLAGMARDGVLLIYESDFPLYLKNAEAGPGKTIDFILDDETYYPSWHGPCKLACLTVRLLINKTKIINSETNVVPKGLLFLNDGQHQGFFRENGRIIWRPYEKWFFLVSKEEYSKLNRAIQAELLRL